MNYGVVIYTLLVGLAWLFIPHPAVVIAAGIAPLTAIIVFRQPYLVCLGFIIFSFFRIHEVFPFLSPLKIPSLLALASLAVLAWHLFIVKTINMWWAPQLTWFAVFFCLVVFGIVFATDRPGAIAYFTGIYVKIGIMTLAIAWLNRSPKDFVLATRLFAVSGIVVALMALYNKANGIGLVEGTRVTIGRDIGSVLGDPNDLSLVLLFPGSFALSLLFAKGQGKFERLFAAIAFGTIIAAIIATQSRGGLLGIMAMSGFFAWHKIKNKAMLIGGGAVAAPILFVAAGISGRSSGGAHEEGIDQSSMGRLYAWEAAFYMALANPITGVGLDNFLANYFAYSQHWDGMNHAVHSTWFGVLGETGFLGIIIFITMLTSLIRRLLRTKTKILELSEKGQIHPIAEPYWYALAAGLASFMTSGTFLTQGFTWPLYILLALSVSFMKYVDDTYEEQKNNDGLIDKA